MKRIILAAALVLGALPATAATVETAEGNWSNLPKMKLQSRRMLDPRMVGQIHFLVSSGQCTMEGQNKRRMDMTIPFAAQFSSDGTLNRVVLKKMGCAEAESIVGGQLVEMIEEGIWKPTGENSEGWYRGEISFSSEA